MSLNQGSKRGRLLIMFCFDSETLPLETRLHKQLALGAIGPFDADPIKTAAAYPGVSSI